LVGATTRVILLRNALLIALAVPLVLAMDFDGVAVAYLIAAVSGIPALIFLVREVDAVRPLVRSLWVAGPTGIAAACGALVLPLADSASAEAPLAGGVVCVAYLTATVLIGPPWWRAEVRGRLAMLASRVAAPAVGSD
jgi:hypothetical protein